MDPSTGKVPCKFFGSKGGCTKGAGCKFGGHTFDSKEERKTRCWECGSTLHRRNECPTREPKSPKKHDKSSPTSSTTTQPQQAPSLQQQAILESLQANSTAASASSTAPNALVASSVPPSASTTTTTDAKEADVKELLKEANAMLSKLAKLQAMEVQTNPAPPNDTEISARGLFDHF